MRLKETILIIFFVVSVLSLAYMTQGNIFYATRGNVLLSPQPKEVTIPSSSLSPERMCKKCSFSYFGYSNNCGPDQTCYNGCCRKVTCTDSDGGINPTVFGKTVQTIQSSPNSSVFSDFCIKESLLKEYSCTKNNGVAEHMFSCKKLGKYECKEGACVPSMPEEYCGNGIVGNGEECDGANLNGATCNSLGELGGKLSCNRGCEFDVSNCYLTSYNNYFQENQNVAAESFDKLDAESKDYFWNDVRESEETGQLVVEPPQAFPACQASPSCRVVSYTETEQKKVVAAKTAHAIWLDKNQYVPWRLKDYSSSELQGLFDQYQLLESGGYAQYTVADYSPSEVYNYLLSHNHVKGTKEETVNSVLDDVRADFKHGVSGVNPVQAYTVLQALTTYDAYNHRISRNGCHSMTRILVAMLRSVNIPGRADFTSGFPVIYYDMGHSDAVFESLGSVLPHGDEIYSADLLAIPSNVFLTPFSFYETNEAPCFGNAICLSHRREALNAVTYPSSYVTARCCSPTQYGYSSCQSYLSSQYSAYLLPEELTTAVGNIQGLCGGKLRSEEDIGLCTIYYDKICDGLKEFG